MSDQDTPEDNRQFEDMLHRLDALMKRNQHGETPVYEFEVETPSTADDAARQDADNAPDEEEIPVLTDVYEGDAPAVIDAPVGNSPDTKDLSALLQTVVESIIQQETDRMRRAVLERLQDEIAAAVRQHFRQDD